MVKSHTHPIGGNTGGANANISILAHATGITADHEHTHVGLYPEGNTNLPTVWYNPEGPHYSGYTRYIPFSDGSGINGNWLGTGNTSNPSVRITDPSHGHDISQTNHSHSLPENTSSNNTNANENRPENFTVKIWKRTA